jgi:transcription initiation factor TFIIE subunit alpha
MSATLFSWSVVDFLPRFDVALWVKNHSTDGDQGKAEPQSSLKIAGSGSGAGKEDDGIEIMMSLDKDEMTRKRERDAEAAAKRQQNALPSWHLKSTISGDLTALGVKEVERAALVNGASSSAAGTSHDEMLRGLGTVSSSRMEKVDIVPEEGKVVVNHESDCELSSVGFSRTHSSSTDYDQYYASLAASSAPSTRDTPSALGGPGSEEGDEDEERKPSVQYLDSLNEYRKRSRSEKDEEGLGLKKVAKVSDTRNGDESSPDSLVTPDQETVDGGEEPEQEGPIVHGSFPWLSFSGVAFDPSSSQSTGNRWYFQR